MTQKIVIPDFDRFVHYGTRVAPWIKLPRKLLGDAKFMTLDAKDQMLLIGLWLLATELPLEEGCGVVVGTVDELRFRLGALSPTGMARLVERGFVRVEEQP